MSKTLIFDTECYINFFYLGVLRLEDGRRVGFEFSDRTDFDREMVRNFMRRNLSVGFNSRRYDLPMLYLALSGASNSDLKDASNHLIQNNVPYWQAERDLGIKIPEKLNHIDLFDTNPSVMDGLKALNGRMHMPRLQELPYPHDAVLTHPQMDEVIEYCQLGDLDGTEELYKRMRGPIDLRSALGRDSGMELRSNSDAQVGERLIKQSIEQKTGQRLQRGIIPEGSKFKYDVPEWIGFETPYMKHVLQTVTGTDIEIGKNGRVNLPKEIRDLNIEFDGLNFTMGIGGLHSTEANRAVRSDAANVLIEGDVASQYPNIVMKLGLFPKATGPDFLDVYKGIIDTRIAAKRKNGELRALISAESDPEKVKRLEVERQKYFVADLGGKIQLNGTYGKLGSGYSVLYAPHLMVAVTLTGQLSLLMLIEKAHLVGIPVVSANTDGIIFRCPRDKWDGFILRDDGSPTDRLKPSPIQDIIDWWEGITSFSLEFNEYEAVYSQSVNTYMAFPKHGKPKRKGVLANHWNPSSPEYDPIRTGLMKNPKMTVCSDAVMAFLQHGTSIESFIRGCEDVREFLTIIRATGGATWRDEYLGNLVRYIWTTEGEPIMKIKAHAKTGRRPKVPSTDGCRPLMQLPDDFKVPADIDYQRYIDEAYIILKDIGYEQNYPVLEWLVNQQRVA